MKTVDQILKSGIERELSEREREILQKIVHLYILKASPIGSRYLSKVIQDEMKLSPATLRNIMADLEEMDFIRHPHTSAGRIPTDKGYRFYVNNFNKIENLNSQEISTIQNNLSKNSQENILKSASNLLGTLSRYLSIVKLPSFKDYKVVKVEIVELSSSRILIVVALESNFIRTVTLELDFNIESDNLTEITRYINEKVSGRPLSFIKENFRELLSSYESANTPLIRVFTDSVDKIFDSQPPEQRVMISGTKNLLYYPEFEDLSRVRGIIELVESEDIIIHILDKFDENSNINVLIGSELETNLLDDYSLIRSKIGRAHV